MNPKQISVCQYCGNKVPLIRLVTKKGKKLYEQIEENRYFEDFDVSLYQCPTCNGISVFGDFSTYQNNQNFDKKRIYPIGASLVPDSHKVEPSNCVPERVSKLYEEIAPLKHTLPNAFAGQIRRALELICKDQGATGKSLFSQLKNLTENGAFPGHFSEVTDLMRNVGNIGAHGGEDEVDIWDAELLDDFFRSVVEYIYVTPAKIQRLKTRLGSRHA